MSQHPSGPEPRWPPFVAEGTAATGSVLSRTLVDEYRNTNFGCGHGADAFVLRIGEYSEPLAGLYMASGVSCAAYVTVFNPQG